MSKQQSHNRHMPTTSVEAAPRWHRLRLPAPSGPRSLPELRSALPPCLKGFDWNAPDVQLRAAEKLASMAASEFEAHHQGLRLWMSVIPRGDRGRLVMPFGVWDRLYPPGFFAAVVSAGYQSSKVSLEAAKVLTSAASLPGGEMTEIDHVLFEVACGLRMWEPKSRMSAPDQQ
jgi:hypothetical protein